MLLEIDFDYLILWGHYRLVTELHERLLGKVSDPGLEQGSVGNLGSAYYRMAQIERSIEYSEQALRLAHAAKESANEGGWLSNLGGCYGQLGQIDQAIDYAEKALAISREVGYRQGEALALGSLGVRYGDIGQTARAVKYYLQAIAIDREVRNRNDEGIDLCNLGLRYAEFGKTAEAMQCLENALNIAQEINAPLIEAGSRTILGVVYFGQGMFGKATAEFKRSIEIADNIGMIQLQTEARWRLALTSLCRDDFAGAREMAEAARQYHFPMCNHTTSLALAVAALRQGDRVTAHEAFGTALSQACEMLARTPKLYAAMDIKALALCGLALYGNPQHIPEAKDAFKTARAINSDSGYVRLVLHLFDATAKADADGILTEVRVEAAGVK